MELRQYTYYLGKNAQLVIQKQTRFDTESGMRVSDPSYHTTGRLLLRDASAIYIDYPLAETTEAIPVNGMGRPIGGSVEIDNNTLVNFSSDVKGVIFNLPSNDQTDSLYLADFIYTMKSCSPKYQSLTKEFQKENEQEYMTSKIMGDVSFFNEDYDFIDSALNKYLFMIEDKVTGVSDIATFSKADCEVDTLTKKITAKLQTIDIYSLVKSKWTTKYNILEALPPTQSITSVKRPVIQLYTLGSSSVTSLIGSNFIETEVTEEKETLDDVAAYGFRLVDHLCEIEIRDSSMPEVIGLYVGSLTSGVLHLSSNPSYYLAPMLGGSTSTPKVGLYKRDDSGATLIARSMGFIERNNIGSTSLWDYGTGPIVMTNPMSFTETLATTLSPILYAITGRILAEKSYSFALPLVALPSSDFVKSGGNYRSFISYSTDSLDALISPARAFLNLHLSGKSLTEPTPYGKNDNDEYFIYDTEYIASNRAVAPVGKDQWANSSIWVQTNNLYDLEDPNIIESCSVEYEIKDCISIASAIKAAIQKTGLPISHEATVEYSTFLYARTWPTNISSVFNKRFYVYISQRTNVLKSRYDQAAKKAEVSLKELLDEMAKLFNCYWFIDPKNRLRIEHISYFLQGGSYSTEALVGADLTTMKDQFNTKEFAYAQQKVKYDSSAFASSYIFSWPAIAFEQFNLESLPFHDGYLAGADPKEIASSLFTTDVSLMLLQPEAFPNDGFALFCAVCDVGTLRTPIVPFKITKKTKVENLEYVASTLNGFASWNSLVHLHLWGAPGRLIAPDGLIGICSNSDGSDARYPTEVKSVKKAMMQENVVFMLENGISDKSLIKTHIGAGAIEKLSINLDTHLATATIAHALE